MRDGSNLYYFDSRVRYSEAGEDLRLTPGSLIDYFQDCSTLHAQDRGVGVPFLQQLGQAWLTVSWQIEISRMPILGDVVRTKTWAYAFQSFFGKRNYTLEGLDGTEYARAIGLWVLMDMKKGVPVRIPDSMMEAYGTEPRLDMEQAPRKIKLPAEHRHKEEPFRVGRQLLDANHHVNNAQYITLAADYLPAGFSIGKLRAEYRMQAKLGDEMVPVIAPAENGYAVSLENTEGKPYAVVIFQESPGGNQC